MKIYQFKSYWKKNNCANTISLVYLIQSVFTALTVSVLWDLLLCSSLKVNQHLWGTCHLHLQCGKISQGRNQHEQVASRPFLATCFMLFSCLSYSSTMKEEEICFSQMLADFQRSTQCYVLEDRTLHNCCCENVKSCITARIHVAKISVLQEMRLL
jgi:hypothetical protein